MSRYLALLLTVALYPVANADDHRAHVNYMIHCQGCHLPDAAGFAGKVPRMKNFVGYFLHSREGREFVIRVPGVATASLPDDELAELMNWLLLTHSAEQLPDAFEEAAPRTRRVSRGAHSRRRFWIGRSDWAET